MFRDHAYTKVASVEMKPFLKQLWIQKSDKINHKIIQVKDELDNTVYTFSCRDGKFSLMCKYFNKKENDKSEKSYDVLSHVEVNKLISVIKESSFKFVLDVNLNGETFIDIINKALEKE